MSALKRIASATAASWIRLAVSMASQLALVPIYLTHWGKDTYGVWIAAQALLAFFQLLDAGHSNFMGGEFLKLGAGARPALARLFYSAVPVAAVVGAVELLALLVFLQFSQQWFLASHNHEVTPELFRQVRIALILQMLIFVVYVSAGGIMFRLLSAFGYYSRIMWWAAFGDMLSLAAPAIAVSRGAGILGVVILITCITVVYNSFYYWDLWQLMKREQMLPVRPDFRLGARNFLHSLILTLKSLLEMLRQQGARVILAPLAGVRELTAFATMRTGANTALQGLNTITNPLLPELMRFLNQRDQARSEGAFGSVWLIVLGLMAPAVVVLQVVAPPLFVVWTRGKIIFDPLLFGSFSLGVLVYALAQPAIAVTMGNNLLRPQLLLSAVTGGTTVAGMFLLVPVWGIRGAAVSLLAAEILAAVGYTRTATYWLKENGLIWPWAAYRRVVAGVGVAGIGMAAIALWPRFKFGFAILCLVAQAVCLLAYWRQLPALARNRVLSLIAGRLPGRWVGWLGRVLS